MGQGGLFRSDDGSARAAAPRQTVDLRTVSVGRHPQGPVGGFSGRLLGLPQDGVLPDRGAPEVPPEALPLSPVIPLTRTAGIPEETVAAMSKADAVPALSDYWTSQL
ncbi:MAG: Cytotoxic translational repressor of toxin-antitoxin stability system [Pseudarthrobacter sp.]|nr:Cytotoxic translational repressor of toxin-antitoxin stability system [Pseudarthrobacter sp.]